MQKTRLGISIGLLGAAVYLAALLGGYIPLILLAGYVLLFEENPWLKRSAVKAAVIVFSFALLTAIIGFIPDIISFFNNLFIVFHGKFSIPVVTNIVNFINTVLAITQKVILIALALKALTQGWLHIKFFDKLIGKHMDQ